ncbi:beta-4C adrenergic receptor-like [Centruroides sculpturatus]|uniref:beta-4C adrenergic receptor-like n=1 Tax=Centruroides sculpturatus TaxID=218467 RepID=UPI000C6CF54A|nr:beta-4C adrenergic receptor-like [Centruroides sculpturatus]XP_023218469.1 beta-4C adrenergic receptor-like [Centruroides sculpturatus]
MSLGYHIDSVMLSETATNETFAEAIVILFICVVVIVLNILVIGTLITSRSVKEAMDFYILSLAVADLLCGVLVIPLSAYPAITRKWMYGDFLCRITGYVEITLWCVTVYTFIWIAVDRYLAVKKPLRYDTIQTRTRCQCWMVFTWITSMFLCCPPLLGFSKGKFYEDGYICMLDLGNTLPYSITLSGLVLIPSIFTVIYTYVYIFSTMYKVKQCSNKDDKDYNTVLSENLSNPEHLMAFVLILFFWLSWLPWFSLHIYEQINGRMKEGHPLHFWLLWLGIADCFWKPIVYFVMSPKMRLGLKVFCMSMCCRSKARQQLVV